MATGILPGRGAAANPKEGDPPITTTPAADPRIARLFGEIALLAASAADVIRDTWEDLPQLGTLSSVAVIGYLADQGVALTSGDLQRGDAIAWLAPYLTENDDKGDLPGGGVQ